VQTPTTTTPRLSKGIRVAIAFAALVNVLVGGSFLVGPELGLQLWPTPIAPVLMRFIAAIVLANGVGAAFIARDGSWARAQVLMLVALVYGAIILAALLYHLLVLRTAPPIFWAYVLVDALFLAPILLVYRHYAAVERRLTAQAT
jgi:hypothetical protein